MPPNPSVFLAETLRGREDITSPPARFLSPHPLPGKADPGFTDHTYFTGFPARPVLVSGNPKETRCLVKLSTSADPETIKFEDQLTEV